MAMAFEKPAFPLGVAAALALAIGFSASNAAAQRASTMIVLDGSNSMNARLPNDKAFKFVTVREALRRALANTRGATELGLTTFGARRPSDCTDVDVAVPPSADTAGVVGALERFQPRGFSPVVLALRTAAKALPAGVDKASIVLVLDDLASCRGEDPCKVAGQLKQQNPALAIHVVGLALKPVDQQVLACVAKQTGGQLFNAADGPGVGPAIEQALKLASIERPVPAPVAAVAPGARAGAVPQPGAVRRGPAVAALIDESRPGLHLSARLTDDGPPIGVPVRWRVWREGDVAGPASLLEADGPVLSRQLPDGRYVVEAHVGLVTVRRPFEIGSQGPTPVRVTLNAAIASIAVPLANGSGPARDAVVTVGLARGRDGEPLWIARTAAADLVVPAGDYRFSAVDGLARVERTVTLAVGATTPVEIVLGAGRLVIEEVGASGASGGGPPQLLIEADDPDSTGGRREIFRAVTARLDTALPVGTYLVTLRRGSVEHRERVPVRPGETVSRSVTMAFARVRLASRGSTAQTDFPISYRIERLDGAAPIIQRWSEPEVVLDLTPGRYRFEARLGAQNAVVAREADVRAGFETKIDLDSGAGSVRLKLKGGGTGLGLGAVYWQIFDDRGSAVWRTGQAEPVLALVAGRYRVRAEVRDKLFERTLDVRAGDSGIVEIGE